MNKEKNLIDQRASLRVDTRETQQINLASPTGLGFPAQKYVTFTELPDQKFFRIYSFDDG